MAGHSHWKQIQHKKGVADQKRSRLFSKLLNAIAVAAKKDPSPQFNPTLRTAIEKAKAQGVPQENIERAINRLGDHERLEELTIEAYGPGGTALLIETVSDNKNRTIAEIKSVLKEQNAKWAEPNSVRWVFEQNFKQDLNEDDKRKLSALITALQEHDDVQNVRHNANL